MTFRKSSKRKFILLDDDEDCNINEKINACSDITANPLKKIFNLGTDDDDVYREANHIYFKTDVNTNSIDKLYKLIRCYKKEIKLLINNTHIGNIQPSELYLHITSYGGSLHEAYLAYDLIKKSTIKINTIVEGYAASAATIMSIAGHRRLITPTSIMLIHQLSTGMYGKYEELKDDYDNSEQDMQKIISLYLKESKGKMKKTFIEEQLKHDKWWDANKCIKYGLVDEILDEI